MDYAILLILLGLGVAAIWSTIWGQKPKPTHGFHTAEEAIKYEQYLEDRAYAERRARERRQTWVFILAVVLIIMVALSH
jgi:hypothetical protein